MLVANSFDLWQKDEFFSAAEEVQQSADIMESTYRTWVRERREGVVSQDLDELCRELQTSLGTAKWQLEEFGKAVRLKYRNCADDITTVRHRQFIAAIESQISNVEAALAKAFTKEHKKPLRWVTLEEDERDDFAAFLSGVPGTSKSAKDESAKLRSPAKLFIRDQVSPGLNLDLDFVFSSGRDTGNRTEVPIESINMDVDANHPIKLEAKEIIGTRDDSRCQDGRQIGTNKTWNSPEIETLKIVIDGGYEQKSSLTSQNEVTPKEKGSKPIFWRAKFRDSLQAKERIWSSTNIGGINWINQIFGRVCRSQRQHQTALQKQFHCSIQLKFVLIVMIFLIGPFLLYST